MEQMVIIPIVLKEHIINRAIDDFVEGFWEAFRNIEENKRRS